MKIYFEDGGLKNNVGIETSNGYWVVDAGDGFSRCYNRVLKYRREEELYGLALPVYTNFSHAINNRFAWNKELQVPEIYLRVGSSWARIDELTDRELRETHNIMKMWIAGEFESEKDASVAFKEISNRIKNAGGGYDRI